MLSLIWRKSHLYLAFISGGFLLLAAVTGIVLSIEPIYLQYHSSHIKAGDDILLSDLIIKLKESYIELISLHRDKYGNLILEAIGETDESRFYVDPLSAKQVGIPREINTIFNFCRDLHRSLFLKETGRFLIGLASVFLFLITISGIMLFLRRVGSWKRFFSKIIQLDFYRDNHARLGRLFLLPVLIISLSGAYLFFLRFGVFKEETKDLYQYEVREENSAKSFLSSVKLKELESLLFPLSEDETEFFELHTQDGSYLVDQFSGQVIHHIIKSKITQWREISFFLHTAEGSSLWAGILFLSAAAMLFFIFSGTKIVLSGRNVIPKENLEEAEIVLLVGSENGHTFRFANEMYRALKQAGQSCIVRAMNDFTYSNSLKELIIFTSTYGDGDAPESASRFNEVLFRELENASELNFSVLGFGSKAYPAFCQYAYEVNNKIHEFECAKSHIDVHTVNENSISDFLIWVDHWSKIKALKLNIDTAKLKPKRKKNTQSFEITDKQVSVTEAEITFLIELALPETGECRSGDLLGIYPPDENIERFYSMAVFKEKGRILLAVKYKPDGLCSNYLYNLEIGEQVQGYIAANEKFNFAPEKKPQIFIANGTGVAPFLGMINENKNQTGLSLYLGIRFDSTLNLYLAYIQDGLDRQFLEMFEIAVSRNAETDVRYVQDFISKEPDAFLYCLENGGVIMLCGSLAMQKGVFQELAEVLQEKGKFDFEYYLERAQIRYDCY